jgi:hypothetical protein
VTPADAVGAPAPAVAVIIDDRDGGLPEGGLVTAGIDDRHLPVAPAGRQARSGMVMRTDGLDEPGRRRSPTGWLRTLRALAVEGGGRNQRLHQLWYCS